MKSPKIVAAAIRIGNKIYVLPPPKRHHHILWRLKDDLDIKYAGEEDKDQGFLDEAGNYLNREEALIVALLNKQVKDESQIRGKKLFSEDLW